MEDPATTTLSQETSPRETLGRRQLLKAIAATGGAVAASTLLPGEWAKPVVEVGVLPAHAQISETPVPTVPVQLTYSVLCDSTPGGGDISLTDFIIATIQPRIEVTSGTGPVQNITATMTAQAVTGLLPSFTPTLPQTATSDASGRAHFPNLSVGGQPGQSFLLVFNFAASTGPVTALCGVFNFGTAPT